jgi:hypothetical protein
MKINFPKCCFDLVPLLQWQLMVAKPQIQGVENLCLTHGIKDFLW